MSIILRSATHTSTCIALWFIASTSLANSISQDLAIADDPSQIFSSSCSKAGTNICITQHLNLYKQNGFGLVRLDVGWAQYELSPPSQVTGYLNWIDTPWVTSGYLPIAVNKGFRLKLDIGALASVPQWFFNQNPGAQFVNQQGYASTGALSYWYPQLTQILMQKDALIFQSLANDRLLNSIAYIVVPLGIANEPLYPSAWTTSGAVTNDNETFWWYGYCSIRYTSANDPTGQLQALQKQKCSAAGAAVGLNYPLQNFIQTMQKQYTTIAAANYSWGTEFTSWSDVVIPNPGAKGQIWADTLNWYRQTKRNFIIWQIKHYQDLVASFWPNAQTRPKLVLEDSGTHIDSATWNAEITNGSSLPQRPENPSIINMTDTTFDLDIANSTGLMVQYPGLANLQDLEYTMTYIKNNGYRNNVWAENAGIFCNNGPGSCSGNEMSWQAPEWVREIVTNGLIGLDFINSDSIFNSDQVTTNGNWVSLIAAVSQLQSAWNNQQTSIDFNSGSLVLRQDSCLYLSPSHIRYLCMQVDGNLVLYEKDLSIIRALWASYTGGQTCPLGQELQNGCHAIFQGDGNFVVYKANQPLYASNTANAEISPLIATQFIMSDQPPYIKIVDAHSDVLWSELPLANLRRSAIQSAGSK